jgi:hypothetical protein
MPTTYAIIKGNQYMDATLYTGSNAAATIINAGAFQPDMAWFKRRDAAASNALNDSVRGVTKSLSSNLNDSEYTSTAGKDLTAFNSNGFSVGATDVWSSYNASGASLVAWQWKAGAGSNVTNTTGTITSTVSANTTAGFSIVTYTGNGSNGASVGHGLGVTPSFIIIKDRTGTNGWLVYHSSISSPTGNYLVLNATSATGAASGWCTPDSSKITFTTSYSGTNTNTSGYVAYCWTPIPGFSAFGSYTGNGSTDGPFIYLGFRPKYLLIKSTTDATNGEWVILDTSRSPYNANGDVLKANTSQAEALYTGYIDILSNGFKLRNNVAGSWTNNSGQGYIYAAWAETPFKYANAR